jgi:organic radical activating enzyme
MLYIQEMFYSVQGEGSRIGIPSVFVRTGLCNFECKGFGVQYMDPKTNEINTGCDSYYAVNSGFKKKWTPYTNFMDLVDDISNCIPNYGKHSLTKPDIVFTGGEPLLYWNDEIYQRTLAYFVSRGHKVTIETNGSLPINFEREYQKKIMFSTSVKLAVSGEPKHKRFNLDTLTKIAEETKNSYFKFVVSKENWDNDIQEIQELLQDLPAYIDVYLMPLGDIQKTLEENAKFIVEKCMELGFNYSDRIHIRIWDNLAGV